uniref:Replication stress response regulator SDE2 n=1 Tax=Plectus sambesii TaxID=2011161 RepID=A0A914WR40_9BILA
MMAMRQAAMGGQRLSAKELLDLSPNDVYVTVNGKIVNDWTTIADQDIFRVHLRLPGGKGGFGSLLRSFRIHRSSNQLMCRDLSGRRLADVKEEEKLRKWISKASDREAEKERKRQEKYARLKQGPPKHQFNDQEYLQQKEEILEKTDDAFEQGLQAARVKTAAVNDPEAAGSSGIGQKRRMSSGSNEEDGSPKKQKLESEDVPSAVAQQPEKGEVTASKTVVTSTVIVETVVPPPPPKLTKKQKKELHEAEKKKAEAAQQQNFESIDLDTIESADDLKSLSLDHLKHALEERGLKCGGSLNERAERLFSVKGLSPEQYPKNIVAPPKKK